MKWFQKLSWFTKSRDGEPQWKNWKFWVSLATIVGVVVLEIGLFPLDSVWAQLIAMGLVAAALFGFELPRPMFDKDQELLDAIHYDEVQNDKSARRGTASSWDRRRGARGGRVSFRRSLVGAAPAVPDLYPGRRWNL